MGERRWGLTVLTAALVAAAALAGGCTALPTGGTPASAPARPALGAGSGGCCGLIVRGPQPDWDPDHIVSGFLLASAKPADNFALAREYLAPGPTGPRNSWRPGSAVIILAGAPQVSKWSGRITGPTGVTVEVTGQEMATLKGSRYTPTASGGQPAQPQSFGLVLVKGRTLIGDLPYTGLMLTDSLFHLVYTARDLFYDGLRNAGLVPSLVPSPVFVPIGSNLAHLAHTLLGDLLYNPPGELRNAIATSFGPGMKFGPVEVAPGKTAIVNFSVPAGTSSKAYPGMARQVVATLTSGGYGQRLFDAVKLRINGTVVSPQRGGPVWTLADAGLDVPHRVGNGSVYYVDSAGTVRALSELAASGRQVLTGAGPGRVPLGDVAVSPDGRYLAGVSEPAGTVYTAGLKPAPQPAERSSAGQLRQRLSGSGFTSLSWDNEDDLWVVGRVGHTAGVWLLYHGRGTPIPVSVPRADVGQVTSVRVAPDGIRVAMLVDRGNKAHLVLGYIQQNGPSSFSITHTLPLGPSLSDVTAMTWFDEDRLVVAARLSPSGPQQGSAGPPAQLWEVPANGDTAVTLHWQQPGVTSITAAGPESSLYLTAGGRLLKSAQLGEPWTFVGAGQAADYPG